MKNNKLILGLVATGVVTTSLFTNTLGPVYAQELSENSQKQRSIVGNETDLQIGIHRVKKSDLYLIQGYDTEEDLIKKGIEVTYNGKEATYSINPGDLYNWRNVWKYKAGRYYITYGLTNSTSFGRYVTLSPQYKNNIEIKGIGDTSYATFELNTGAKKIEVYNTKEDINLHDYFDGAYAGIELYDSNMNVKKSLFMKGTEPLKNNKVFQDIKKNGISYEYGDIIRVHHREPQSRLKMRNMSSASEINTYYRITQNGLEKIDPISVNAPDLYVAKGKEHVDLFEGIEARDILFGNDLKFNIEILDSNVDTNRGGAYTVKYKVSSKIAGSGTEKTFTRKVYVYDYTNTITVKGYGDTTFAKFNIDKANKRINITDTTENSHVHDYFNNYAGITLLDENLNEKYNLDIKGTEPLNRNEKFQQAKKNGIQFEYGDIIEVRHSEPTRLDISNINEVKDKVTRYRITENGLVQMRLENNNVNLKGNNDKTFVKLSFDKNNRKIRVVGENENTKVHSSYNNYAWISIIDGKTKSEKSRLYIKGNNTLSNNSEFQKAKREGISFNFGDIINISHSEPTRLDIAGIDEEKSVHTYYKITPFGLVQTGNPNM